MDTRRFNPGLGSKDIRIALGDGQGCLAVYAGLHGIAQGLDQVLDAAAMLQDMKDLSIVLIGDGPEKKTLMKHARLSNLRNIRFLDPYPNHAIPAILASADIALIPLKDQFAGAVPSKLYEAMGAGLPVVMAAGGEAGDILQKAKAGMVIPPGDVEALASALRLLARDREKRVELGKNGRQAAVTLFDRKSIADKFIDFLEKARPGIMMSRVYPSRMCYGIAKRCFDICLSAITLALLSPVFLIVAIAVNVILKARPFIEDCVWDGTAELFTIYKFRQWSTMLIEVVQ